jgi:hypothetical protein
MVKKVKNPPNWATLIGKDIQNWRRQDIKVNNVEFSKKIDLSYVNLSNIETGKVAVGGYELYLMRKKFGLDVNKLFDGIKNEH